MRMSFRTRRGKADWQIHRDAGSTSQAIRHESLIDRNKR
jgi:hypothetical protein